MTIYMKALDKLPRVKCKLLNIQSGVNNNSVALQNFTPISARKHNLKVNRPNWQYKVPELVEMVFLVQIFFLISQCLA